MKILLSAFTHKQSVADISKAVRCRHFQGCPFFLTTFTTFTTFRIIFLFVGFMWRSHTQVMQTRVSGHSETVYLCVVDVISTVGEGESIVTVRT